MQPPVSCSTEQPSPRTASSSGARQEREAQNGNGSLVFLGRQPLLDRHGRLAAYDLLFRDSQNAEEARIDDPLAATAQVLVATFAELGAEERQGGTPIFVNADPKLEIADHVRALPAYPLIFDLPREIALDSATIERIEELRGAGFDLCLDDFGYQDERAELLEFVGYVKVDFSRHTSAQLRKIARVVDAACVSRIACRIENEKSLRIFEQQEWALAQGFYFAHPEQIVRHRPSTRRGRILEVLGEIDEETPTEEVARHLRGVPNIIMNLIAMANLMRASAGQRIESIEQAVVMLGRKRLIRWLHLLLFASDDPNGCADPLCQLMANRSTLMESLAKSISGRGVDPDRAALTGLLSLTAAFVDLDPKEMCRRLSLDYEIEKALIRRKGELGLLLSLVEALEAQNFAFVRAHLEELGIEWSDLERAEVESIKWGEGLSSLSTRGSGRVRVN